MVETSKQVRVDNWGIYFLQRLQLFFSKTDYCDLTLQFEGNVQLKVHRLVMNACTEYFTFLEQTCSAMEENTILMPSNLQADVIVPIVNFMYTGMLEFHPSIFDKLYAAAETMNIAVLTKLLEAQLAPMSSKTTTRLKRDSPAPFWKKPAKVSAPAVEEINVPTYSKKPTPWRRKPTTNAVQSHPASATFSSKWASGPSEKDPLFFPDNTPKPTRFEWPEDEIAPMSMYPSFDDVSLTSKPLWTKDDDQKAVPVEEPVALSRFASNSPAQDIDEPPATQDQKINAAPLDNAIQNDVSNKRKVETKSPISPKRIKISTQDDETVISITTSNPSELDHTKIVSEVLKKYPDLVKKKRNLKLKIIQAKPDSQPVKNSKENAVVKLPTQSLTVEPQASSSSKETPSTSKETSTRKNNFINSVANKKKPVNPLFKSLGEEGPWTCLECANQDREGAEFVLYYLFRKHMASQHQVEFDSSLCKYCGKKCSKESAMVYHLYIKHGLKPPKDVIYPKCNKCPFIAVTVTRLQQHMRTHGKDETQCSHCHLGFYTKRDLQTHQRFSAHSNRKSSILECAYCQKKLQSPVTLFTHVRSQHMKEAKRDGVTSLNEVLDVENEDDFTEPEIKKNPESDNTEVDAAAEQPKKKNKESVYGNVKILSNVQVSSQEDNLLENSIEKEPETTPLPEAEPRSVAVSAATTLTNIGNSLATNLGLVDIVVLDDNQQYILQQPQGQTGNAEFILPPELTGGEGILQAAAATGELNSTDELVMVLTDHDYQDEQNQDQTDNSNIVVLYSHPVEGQQGQFITSQGNLLVNSEGMLEIRNGTAITTTAGQILVNTDSTTTTQAIGSPVESIDLIRREIESTVGNEHRDSLKITDESAEPNKSDEIVQESTEVEKNTVDSSLDDQPSGSEVVDAAPQSSVTEECMEVDEDVLQEKESLATDLEQAVDQLPENTGEPENMEQLHLEEHAPEENEGQDVPPETNLSLEVPHELDSGELNATLIINDPNSFEEPSELSNTDEPMEVGSLANQSYEEGASVDEVDEHFPSSDVVTDVAVPSEPNEPEPEKNVISDETEAKEAPTINNDTEIHEEPVKNKEREDDRGNSCLQTQYEDFTTDDSQQSSSQKQQRTELDKEILDDWNDTDSQQSQGHEQESQEDDASNVVNLNSNQATENVNKLMDDWDEEDEDQSKE